MPAELTHSARLGEGVCRKLTPTRNAIGLSRPTPCVAAVADGRLSFHVRCTPGWMKRRRFEHLGMLHCGEFLDSFHVRCTPGWMKRRRFEHLGMLHCGEFLDSPWRSVLPPPGPSRGRGRARAWCKESKILRAGITHVTPPPRHTARCGRCHSLSAQAAFRCPASRHEPAIFFRERSGNFAARRAGMIAPANARMRFTSASSDRMCSV